MNETKVETLNLEERKKILEKELEGCIDVKYPFSKVSGVNDQIEITIPVIFLKEKPNNKHGSVELTMRGTRSAVNGNMGERKERMFLNIDHKDDRCQLCNELPDAIDIGNMEMVSV